MTATHQDNQRTNMGYLIDFEKALENRDPPALLRLWEEYTSSDEVDGEDFRASLAAIKNSDLHDYVGRHIERAIPLWQKVENKEKADEILRLIVDLQVTNSPELLAITIAHLEEKFSHEKDFSEKMRLIGLRGGKADYTGAISHYLLLNHMSKGNFVYHTAGWGVGEIMDVSMLREQVGIEFDYVPGKKDLAFAIAFNTLIPIPKTHFLAQRFGNPDALEEKARKNPVDVIRMLLNDLGPKAAAEIKDELCELVIPEKEWNRWWQTARSKLKKDTQIENPQDLKDPFRLLKEEVSHEERLQKALESKPNADTLIQMVYSFVRDFPETLKNNSFKESLISRLKELLSFTEITQAQELQIHFFLEDLTGEKDYAPTKEIVKNCDVLEKLIDAISILTFKKRVLVEAREARPDWMEQFLKILFKVDQAPIRDYLIQELQESDGKKELKEKLEALCIGPENNPEMIIWYFQKCLNQKGLPHSTQEGLPHVFEAFLIALAHLEQKGERRDLIKRMHGILSADRYAIVRNLMKKSSVNEVKEFLLLITKCHSLSDHDIKIFYSLAEVAHPSLKRKKRKGEEETVEDIIWTTKEGYAILQKKIEQIGTVETVENAKEIEVARAHGDLRENAEFKAALERRDRLQAELKFLSTQLNKSRILTHEDFDKEKVAVGAKIHCTGEQGEEITYTLLGPWDADPDKNILSFQSKLAKNMLGLKVGDSFEVQGKKLTIASLESAI